MECVYMPAEDAGRDVYAREGGRPSSSWERIRRAARLEVALLDCAKGWTFSCICTQDRGCIYRMDSLHRLCCFSGQARA